MDTEKAWERLRRDLPDNLESNPKPNSVDDIFTESKKAMKRTMIFAGIGGLAGATAGVYLGNELNNYVDALKQAPSALQYAVDAVGAFVLGSAGAGIGGVVGQITGAYKIYNKITK